MTEADTDQATTVKDEIRHFIIDNFLFGDETQEICDEDSFLQTNLIDSTGILELVSFIERTFGITVKDEELLPENLDSLANATRFVVTKRDS